ncbi:MAG: hypothetical protein C4538_11285 [Nitrospiraceae bacterium]|nr:MAG: hypothetical protein C4538_11285 [Nitrospiraceae bacterium]
MSKGVKYSLLLQNKKGEKMKHRRNRNNEMLKHMGKLSVLLVVAVNLIWGASLPNSWADNDRNELPFKAAEMFIEFNSTAGDTGLQVFLDDDNWREITISDPRDKTIFTVKGKSTLGRQGLTELFFESVEPELADLPIVKFLKRFPRGDYEFEGIRNDGVELESEVEFTHVIPCGPEVLPKDGTVLDTDLETVIRWAEVKKVVDPAATDAAGETVCTEPINLGQHLEINSYQVILENSDIRLIVDLTSSNRFLTVPSELLKDNTLYIFEVLAKEVSGNQTITEGFFCTGPDLEEEDCVNLFETR